MEIAKVTSKGQITIPKEVRDELDLSPGSKVVFLSVGNEVVIRKAGSLESNLSFSSPIVTRQVAENTPEYDAGSSTTGITSEKP